MFSVQAFWKLNSALIYLRLITKVFGNKVTRLLQVIYP